MRDVEPGEVLTIDDEGVHSHRPSLPSTGERLCVFEFVYLARPDLSLIHISSPRDCS